MALYSPSSPCRVAALQPHPAGTSRKDDTARGLPRRAGMSSGGPGSGTGGRTRWRAFGPQGHRRGRWRTHRRGRAATVLNTSPAPNPDHSRKQP